MSSSKSKNKRGQRSTRNRSSKSTLMPEPSSLFDEPITLDSSEPMPAGRSTGRASGGGESLLSEFSFTDAPPSRTGRQTNKPKSDLAPVALDLEAEPSPKQAQVSLLEDFWVDQAEEEENEKEDARLNDLFTDSIHNTKSGNKSSDEALSKRIQVGLYPADADLLEELYQQSKAAGLKNVSRARILRVALRHFHTCWLNADQS